MVQSRTIENRYRVYPGGIHDTNVRTWLDARQAANSPAPAGWAVAVDRAVTRLKATPSLVSGLSNWYAIDTLFMPFQSSLLAGALVPIKGVCTNVNFVQGDLTAIGLKGSAASQKSLGLGNSRLAPNASMGVWAWGALTTCGLIGRVTNLSIQVQGSNPGSILYRSFSTSGPLYPAWSGLIGWSRLNSTDLHCLTSRSTVQTLAVAANASPSAATLSGFQVGGGFAWADAPLALLWHGQAVDLTTVQQIFNELMLPFFGG